MENAEGVYLFARFDNEPPPGPVDPLEKSVIYVGQCQSPFKNRWDPFDRGLANPHLAKANPRIYPRAIRYIALFGSDRSRIYVATLKSCDLMKAFLRLGCCSLLDLNIGASTAVVDTRFADEIKDLLIKYMERRLILLYACRYGHRPALNKA